MLRFGQSAEILTWGLNFMVLALSGVFNPVDALPAADPADRPGPADHPRVHRRAQRARRPTACPWDELVAGAVGTVVLMALAFSFVVHMLGMFRRKGLVTRFSLSRRATDQPAHELMARDAVGCAAVAGSV